MKLYNDTIKAFREHDLRPFQPNCVNVPKEFTTPSLRPRANRAYRG